MDKETLQKKIESGNMVWAFSWASGEKRIVEINLQENEPKISGGLLYFWDSDFIEHRYGLEDIFATKKDAEWELEFGNITRPEKLELPTWESFRVYSHFGFAGKNIHHCYMEYDINEKNERVISVCGKKFDFNYDGYLEACRFCKKLFWGVK